MYGAFAVYRQCTEHFKMYTIFLHTGLISVLIFLNYTVRKSKLGILNIQSTHKEEKHPMYLII